MNEPSGTAMVDASGVSGNGTYSASGVTLGSTSIVPQDPATCVTFDGTNNNATRAHVTPLALTTGITVMAWVKPDTVKGQAIVFKWDAFFLDIITGATPAVRWLLHGLSGGLMYSPSNSIVAGGVYMVAGTFDGTNQKVYLNGLEVANVAHTPGSTFASSNQNLEVGSNGSFFGGGKIQGRMSHLSIFNVGLSAATIQSLYLLGWETASTTLSSVHAFAKQVIAANSSRTKLTITNNSGITMWLGLGGTAEVGKGIRLNGLGGVWVTTKYTGAVSAIHSSASGVHNVDMVEQT
jgi:hypothetical protein